MRQQKLDELRTTQPYGTLTHEGKTLVLINDTHYANYVGTWEHPFYEALAVSSDNILYQVKWLVTNEQADDADQACDWSQYDITAIQELDIEVQHA